MESDKRPGESDRAWFGRLAEMSAQQVRKARDDKREIAGYQAAEVEKLRNQADDDQLDGWMRDTLGGSLGQIQHDFDKYNVHTPKLDQAMREVNRASRKGWTQKTRAKNVKRAINKNKGVIRQGVKAANKKKGCVVIGLLFLGALAGVAYGSYEGLSALMSG